MNEDYRVFVDKSNPEYEHVRMKAASEIMGGNLGFYEEQSNGFRFEADAETTEEILGEQFEKIYSI